MLLRLDSDQKLWQVCLAGRVNGQALWTYLVGSLAWQLFVVVPVDLVAQLEIDQIYEATLEHDGCGVIVTILHRIEQPAWGAEIIALTACRNQTPFRLTS